MPNIGKIIWLSSYPKSGNTWFRAFLSSIISAENSEININNLFPTKIANSRELFDDSLGISTADLNNEEIDQLRPRVFRLNALESKETIYYKIHNSWRLLRDGTEIFPKDVTKGVLYFIRNPLDIVVSFSHHLNCSIEKTISLLNNQNFALSNGFDGLHNQLPQHLGTWSDHVKSWVDFSNLPLLVIRYEDMIINPFVTFSNALSFIGISESVTKINTALESVSFNRLKKQEELRGFSEKSAKAISFFRKGEIGDWKRILTIEQVERVLDAHQEIMLRFGYL